MKKEFVIVLLLAICGALMILWTLFGGNDDNDLNLETDEGFVYQISGDISTGFDKSEIGNERLEINIDINTGVIIKTSSGESKDYTEVRFMMPRYFYTSGWKKFAQDLYTNKKVYLKFIFVDNLNEYRNLVMESGFNQADLILFPLDRYDDLYVRFFTFQQSLSSAFDSFVSDLVKDKNIGFLPFSADPMLIYSLSGYIDNISFSNISDVVYNWTAPKIKSFPLFFGLAGGDYSGEGFSREYQDIVRYALMHYFSSYHDNSSLEEWIDSNVLDNYNISTVNEILNLISPTLSACSDFPSICFQLYKFVGIRFGFLSDVDIVKQYFENKYDIMLSINKNMMPFFGLESPVRIRGFSIPSTVISSDVVNAIYIFLMQYMNDHSDYNLWGSTISVFSGGQAFNSNEFIGPRGYVLFTGGNYIATLKNNSDFRKLIRYQISAKNYLDNL